MTRKGTQMQAVVMMKNLRLMKVDLVKKMIVGLILVQIQVMVKETTMRKMKSTGKIKKTMRRFQMILNEFINGNDKYDI